jgi:hypothetical protein
MTCLKQLPKNGGTSAGCQPAIQQTASLRYNLVAVRRVANFGIRVLETQLCMQGQAQRIKLTRISGLEHLRK